MTSLTSKLQLKPGTRLAVLALPPGAELDLPADEQVDDPADAEAVLVFIRTEAELTTLARPAVQAARRDELAWIAYPKAGQLGTDLSRDRLAAALNEAGIQPVRQIAIDGTWSALRCRPR